MSSAPLRRGDWICLLAALGGAALVALLVVLPQHKAIRAAEAEMTAKNLTVQQDALVLAQVAVAQRDLAAAEEYVAGWKERSPGGTELASLFGRIAQLAASCGVEVVRFEPQTSIDLAQLQRVPLELECRGDFDALFSLLRELESLPRDVWVEDFDVSRSEDGQSMRCALRLEVFADKPEISD